MRDGLPLPRVSLTLTSDQCEDTVINESRLLLVHGFHPRDWELEDCGTEMLLICLPAVNNSWGGQRAGAYLHDFPRFFLHLLCKNVPLNTSEYHLHWGRIAVSVRRSVQWSWVSGRGCSACCPRWPSCCCLWVSVGLGSTVE